MKTLTIPIAVLVAWLSVALPSAEALDDVVVPPVPVNLQVPDGNSPFLVGHATGTQNYICLQTGSGRDRFAWSFLGPQATLFDGENEQITTHYLSPNPIENGLPRATWQHSADTSAVWASAIASSTDPNYVAPGAIPWLLLRIVGSQPGPGLGDALAPTTFIQRVHTFGGVAPAAGCSLPADVGKRALVPYTTDYIFYRAQ